MSKKRLPYCTNCGHKDELHGDRVFGGICMGAKNGRQGTSHYPDICDCQEWKP